MIKITPSGDSILILENFIGKSHIQISRKLEKEHLKGVEDIISLQDKIGIIYNPYITSSTALNDILAKLLNSSYQKSLKLDFRIWEIPICYDEEFSLDIEDLCSLSHLEKNYIIEKHLERSYTVDMIGFLPGFLYLGDLDKALYFNRKSNPRKKVPKGSVGIAGNQSGIYNIESPGGWNIIGRTPMELFRKEKNPPLEIRQGDKIIFKRITREQFDQFNNV